MENELNKYEPTIQKDVNEIRFCKSHNMVYSTQNKENPDENEQHIYCNTCPINDIEEEKRNKLKENIKSMDDLKYNVQENADKLKIIIEKINENKEELKMKIQKVFTKVRNALNDREEALFLEVDNTYEDLFFNKDISKEGEKLPNKLKKSLEKAKSIDNEWKKDKLESLINDCINIESNIKELITLNEDVNKFNKIKIESLEFKFIPEENDINYFFNEIAKFGLISYNEFNFKKCPDNIKDERKYIITGEQKNIFTKIGADYCWTGNICEKQLDQSKEKYSWKIKILKSFNYNIMVGVATIDFDINSSSCEIGNNCGWYYYCINGTLYSGAPQNYQGKLTNIKLKNNEIKIIMNMKKRTLKFSSDKEDKEDTYTDIPIDKPLFPSILLRDIYDSVEIIECE